MLKRFRIRNVESNRQHTLYAATDLLIDCDDCENDYVESVISNSQHGLTVADIRNAIAGIFGAKVTKVRIQADVDRLMAAGEVLRGGAGKFPRYALGRTQDVPWRGLDAALRVCEKQHKGPWVLISQSSALQGRQ